MAEKLKARELECFHELVYRIFRTDSKLYSNRSDFINQAVRQCLDQKQGVLDRIITQQETSESTWFLGIYSPECEELERIRQTGKKIRIRGYGLLVLGESLDDLIEETVSQIHVRGKVVCSKKIREKFGL